jgi:hypothetical protein
MKTDFFLKNHVGTKSSIYIDTACSHLQLHVNGHFSSDFGINTEFSLIFLWLLIQEILMIFLWLHYSAYTYDVCIFMYLSISYWDFWWNKNKKHLYYMLQYLSPLGFKPLPMFRMWLLSSYLLNPVKFIFLMTSVQNVTFINK